MHSVSFSKIHSGNDDLDNDEMHVKWEVNLAKLQKSSDFYPPSFTIWIWGRSQTMWTKISFWLCMYMRGQVFYYKCGQKNQHFSDHVCMFSCPCSLWMVTYNEHSLVSAGFWNFYFGGQLNISCWIDEKMKNPDFSHP